MSEQIKQMSDQNQFCSDAMSWHFFWLISSLSPYSSHNTKLIDWFVHHVCPGITDNDSTTLSTVLPIYTRAPHLHALHQEYIIYKVREEER